MNLVPWEPFEGLTPLREAMNQLLEGSFVGLNRFEPFGRIFPMDVLEKDGEYVIEASLPGAKPEQVQITATETALTIRATMKGEGERGEEKGEKKDKEGTYVRRERYTGEISRMVTLPMPIDPDKITATYAHGVLTLQVLKAPKSQPKQIPVRVNEKGEATVH
jgi:HSP20 family protein